MQSIIDIVVPVFGGADITWRCLTHLELFGMSGQRIILVDDGTVWATREGKDAAEIEEIGRYLQTKGGLFLRHDANKGPHAAWNTGWRSGRARHVAFVNNDIVIGPGCMTALMTAMLQGKHYACARELQGGDFAPARLLASTRGRGHASSVKMGDHFNACFVTHRWLLEKLSGFDESMRLAYSDTDFIERMRDLGHEPCIVEDAIAFHGVSVTRRRALGAELDLAIEDADRARFEEKWKDRLDVLARHPRVSGDDGRRAREIGWGNGERA